MIVLTHKSGEFLSNSSWAYKSSSIFIQILCVSLWLKFSLFDDSIFDALAEFGESTPHPLLVILDFERFFFAFFREKNEGNYAVVTGRDENDAPLLQISTFTLVFCHFESFSLNYKISRQRRFTDGQLGRGRNFYFRLYSAFSSGKSIHP